MSKTYTLQDAANYRAYFVAELAEAKTGEPVNEALAASFRKSQSEWIAECERAIAEFDALGAQAMVAKWQAEYDLEQQSIADEMDCFAPAQTKVTT